MTDKPPSPDELVKDALSSAEGRTRLAASLHDVIRKEQHRRASEPLCHRVCHPFLGRSGFKDTCPICGFKAS
jgi:hypothetical protein